MHNADCNKLQLNVHNIQFKHHMEQTEKIGL